MTETNPPLDRRNLIRGGAVLAGAVGATAIGAAIAPTEASAADGQAIVQGADNEGSTTTTVGIAASTTAALRLVNSGGPALRLQPITGDSWQNLQAGELAASDNQLYVGFGTEEADRFGVPVATWLDLDYCRCRPRRARLACWTPVPRTDPASSTSRWTPSTADGG